MRFVLAVVVVALGVLLSRQVPGVRRYLKMRRM